MAAAAAGEGGGAWFFLKERERERGPKEVGGGRSERERLSLFGREGTNDARSLFVLVCPLSIYLSIFLCGEKLQLREL
jgi:hypothetical protein